MNLGSLWPEAAPELATVEISGVTADSRAVLPGFLFVAVPGVKADGAQFAADASARGAAVIVAQRGAVMGTVATPVVEVPDARSALSKVAARFFHQQPATIVAVTGTSGKTSVAEFARQLFAACGRKAASVGTLGVMKHDGLSYGSLTTPDPVALHRTLAALASEGVTHLAMEASSHGLDQKRLDGVLLKAAAFTNLGHDHLDYHRSVEDYLGAKRRLFTTLLPGDGAAVVNMEGARSADVATTVRERRLRLITVGAGDDDIRLDSSARSGFSQLLSISYLGARYDISLPLVGDFQAQNALVAAGLAIAVGEAPATVFSSLSTLRGVPGRLDKVGEARGGVALVDYAHKPDALTAALDAVRPFVSGKLIVVFGCGGDRDKAKRPIMGAIAVQKADLAIVTDDNPRSEDPAQIRREIMAAAKGATEIGDRAEAIHAAIARMRRGDVVVVAGKGHEPGQIVGDRILPFSDHDVVRAALKEAGA